MKIIHIIPGSGGSFYCQNCVRDAALVMAQRALGHDVIMAPMYLPLFSDEPDLEQDSPIFYGAINVYLKQNYRAFRRAPRWLQRCLDRRSLLTKAAHQAASVRATGLEAMTLSVLRGEDGHQASELDRLIDWLTTEKPDIVHLSNALLLGIAPRMRHALDARLICSLQDEDAWVDAMQPNEATVIWETMAAKTEYLDCFTPVSRFYRDVMQKRLHIPDTKLSVVHAGSNLTGYTRTERPFDPPVIGYLSRMGRALGLELLIDAFLLLKTKPAFASTRLRVTGGKTGDDLDFLSALQSRLVREGLDGDVDFVEDFDRPNRIRFLQSLTVLSVPVLQGEAFGTYLTEAMGCGVPVVQPALGAFPEIVDATGGGRLYEPNTPDALADAWEAFLSDRAQVENLGQHGHDVVHRDFTIETMARRMVQVYGRDSD